MYKSGGEMKVLVRTHAALAMDVQLNASPRSFILTTQRKPLKTQPEIKYNYCLKRDVTGEGRGAQCLEWRGENYPRAEEQCEQAHRPWHVDRIMEGGANPYNLTTIQIFNLLTTPEMKHQRLEQGNNKMRRMWASGHVTLRQAGWNISASGNVSSGRRPPRSRLRVRPL